MSIINYNIYEEHSPFWCIRNYILARIQPNIYIHICIVLLCIIRLSSHPFYSCHTMYIYIPFWILYIILFRLYCIWYVYVCIWGIHSFFKLPHSHPPPHTVYILYACMDMYGYLYILDYSGFLSTLFEYSFWFYLGIFDICTIYIPFYKDIPNCVYNMYEYTMYIPYTLLTFLG